MSPFKPSEEVKEFAKEIAEKIYWRFHGKQLYISDLTSSLKDMLQHKMSKEGWKKDSTCTKQVL